jgi:GntR family transcriptional regulator
MDDARRLRDVLRFEFADSAEGSRVFPDERELSRRLACSRNTLRDALNLLRDDQLIERRPGLGTFVRDGAAPLVGSRNHGLVHNIDRGDERVRYQLVDVQRVPSTGLIGAALGAPTNESLVVLTRLTIVDDVPVVLWDTYVRQELGESLAESNPYGDVYDLLQRAGVDLSDVSLQISAVLADAAVAELLDVSAGQPLLRFERTVFDTSRQCVAVSFGRARGDRVQISANDHLATETIRPFPPAPTRR